MLQMSLELEFAAMRMDLKKTAAVIRMDELRLKRWYSLILRQCSHIIVKRHESKVSIRSVPEL